MINSRDISIIVQGPILTDDQFGATTEMTKLVCYRLKNLFPESELILSTWEGENVKGIMYDKLVFNKDPGASWFDFYNHNNLNNCNRLIVSTLAGIKLASRKYVLKVRSDLFLVSKRFLKYFDKFPLYNEEFKFVKSRILAFSMWSIRGHKTPDFTMLKPYHISDWVYFGYKEDVLNLYDISLINNVEFSQWFLHKSKPFHDVAPQVLWRMPPEQYITSSFLKKYIDINLEHTADDTNNNQIKSAQLLMNAFIVLDQTQYFFISLKHGCFQFDRKNHEWFMYHSTWLNDYRAFIPTHSKLNQLKLGMLVIARFSCIYLFYNVCRFLNAKYNYISRLSAYFIKKWAEAGLQKGLPENYKD